MQSINRLSPRAKNIKPSATLSLSAKVKALNAAGAGVIGFTAGEPDFDTPQHIKQTAIDALNAGKTKYMPVQGDLALDKQLQINCNVKTQLAAAAMTSSSPPAASKRYTWHFSALSIQIEAIRF